MNLHRFKLYRVCLDPLNLSNVFIDFSWSSIFKDIIQVQKEKGKQLNSKSCMKYHIRGFHIVVVQWTSKK